VNRWCRLWCHVFGTTGHGLAYRHGINNAEVGRQIHLRQPAAEPLKRRRAVGRWLVGRFGERIHVAPRDAPRTGSLAEAVERAADLLRDRIQKGPTARPEQAAEAGRPGVPLRRLEHVTQLGEVRAAAPIYEDGRRVVPERHPGGPPQGLADPMVLDNPHGRGQVDQTHA
jgi:hypothetical protein